MLHKCANPNCTKPFRKLSEGKLFLVETDAAKDRDNNSSWDGGSGRHLEYFWLCAECSHGMTLRYEKDRGVVAVPLRPRPKAERSLSTFRKATTGQNLQKPA